MDLAAGKTNAGAAVEHRAQLAVFSALLATMLKHIMNVLYRCGRIISLGILPCIQWLDTFC